MGMIRIFDAASGTSAARSLPAVIRQHAHARRVVHGATNPPLGQETPGGSGGAGNAQENQIVDHDDIATG